MSVMDPNKRQKKPLSKTRATKACNGCRKQKTRCFPSQDAIGCLRCISLSQLCSFEQEVLGSNSDGNMLASKINPNFIYESNYSGGTINKPLSLAVNSSDNRLRLMQNDISEILSILKSKPSNEDAHLLLQAAESAAGSVSAQSNTPVNTPQTFNSPSYSFLSSPFATISQSTNHNSLPYSIQHLISPKSQIMEQDIITLGIITKPQAITLMQNFRDRYGRWVSFPSHISTDVLIEKIRYRCSLLLTTCCCLSLRYSDPTLKSEKYQLLLHKLQNDLNHALLLVPQSIEFLQALVILSIYALSLSTESIVFDAWVLSGIAIKHFITRSAMGTLLQTDDILLDKEFKELTIYRIWNHLCLVHLANCVLSGRMCIIDEVRLDHSRKSLDLPTATNFDGRMVSEIAVQLITYNFIHAGGCGINDVLVELQNWYDQWGYLFEQPNTQFVEFCYHYCYSLVLYHWNYVTNGGSPNPILMKLNRTAKDSIEPSLWKLNNNYINIMVFHCDKVLNAILTLENDSYFAFLSDQIHFNSLFACILLIKLLFITSTRTSSDSLNDHLSNVTRLLHRFRRVSTDENDAVYKYSVIILENLKLFFPEFDIDNVD